MPRLFVLHFVIDALFGSKPVTDKISGQSEMTKLGNKTNCAIVCSLMACSNNNELVQVDRIKLLIKFNVNGLKINFFFQIKYCVVNDDSSYELRDTV